MSLLDDDLNGGATDYLFEDNSPEDCGAFCCDIGGSDHAHCEGCERVIPAGGDGACIVCVSEWMAVRQLPMFCDTTGIGPRLEWVLRECAKHGIVPVTAKEVA